MRRALPLLATALLGSGCFLQEEAIHRYEASYRSDTELLNKVMAPLGVEQPHGQVTVVISSKFTEKLVRASLQPNTLTLSVRTPGRAWHEEVKRLMTFENELTLDAGKMDLAFGISDLALRGDMVVVKGKLDGQGELDATMKYFGVTAKRGLMVAVRYDDVLQLHVEHGPGRWLLRLVGPPLKVHVDVQVPALHLGGRDLMDLKFSRDVDYAVENVSPWDLPLPAPQTVNVGTTTLSLGLKNFSVGTRDGLLWAGADVDVGDPVVPEVGTVPAVSPARPAAAPPAPAPAASAPAAAPARPVPPAPPAGVTPVTPGGHG